MALTRINSGRSGMFDGSWKNYFPPIAIPDGTVLVKARKQGTQSGDSCKDNIITDGSIICVGYGQAAIVTEGGRVVNIFTEPGEHEFHSDRSPSLLRPGGLKATMRESWRRFTFGGAEVGCTPQHLFYVRTHAIFGISIGSGSRTMPIQMRDRITGSIVSGNLICSGTVSCRVKDPYIFYRNFTRGVDGSVSVADVQRALRPELDTIMQTVACRLTSSGVRPFEASAMGAGFEGKVRSQVNQELLNRRGLEITELHLAAFTVTAAVGSELDAMLALVRDSNAYSPSEYGRTKVVPQEEDYKPLEYAGKPRPKMSLLDMPGASGFSRKDAPAEPKKETAPQEQPHGGFFETPAPCPFRLVDKEKGLDVEVGLLCEGFYTYSVKNPQKYDNNIIITGSEEALEEEIKSFCVTSIQKASASLTENGILPREIPALVSEIRLALLENLIHRCGDWAGLDFTAAEVTVYSVTLGDKVIATSAASQERETPKGTWTCGCGQENEGKFCTSCGKKRPAACCGNCGYTPEDPAHPPKFCPECGKPFGE